MSILSALLTQDQVVTPRKIDEAIQRQVISGGDFETNLLEVGGIAENCLAGYCGLVYDMVPATREDVLAADEDLVARLPRALAERVGALPLRVEDGVALVAVARPLDDDARRALSAALGAPVAPRLVAGVRVAWALQHHYGVPMSPRFLRLSERLANQSPGALPAQRMRSAPLPATARAAERAVSALAALEAALQDDDEHPPRTPSLPSPPRAPRALHVDEAPAPSLHAAPTRRPEPTRDDAAARRTIRIGEHRRPLPDEPPSTRPLPPVRSTDEIISLRAARVPDTRELLAGARPLDLAEARRILAEAGDRETLIDALLDHAAQSFAYVALFAVHGDVASGLSSRGDGLAGTALRALQVPLSAPGALARAKESGVPVVERIVGADIALRDKLLRRASGDHAVLPLKLKGKVALLLWADDGPVASSAAAVRALESFVAECAAAFTRLILSRKRASQPPPGAGAPSSLDPLASLRPRAEQRRSSIPSVEARVAALRAAVLTGERRSAPPPRRSRGGAEGASSTPSLIPADRDAAARLLEEVERGGVSGETAAAELVAIGERALDAIFRRFPGPNTIVRADVSAKLPTASTSGPVLRVVVALRDLAVPRLLATLVDPDPDRRFCALLCLAEVVHPSALPHLSPLLTDPDYPTRMAAIEVLRGYRRLPEFSTVGATLRAVIRDPRASADVRRAAAHAAGELRDSDAVTALVATLSERDPSVVAAAHRALVVLARQDFGTDATRWIEWWHKASARHRVEWLIDALNHADATIRHEAGEELKKLTGQFFGYYFNLPRKERERAQQRYLEWWQREGAARASSRPSTAE